jgi:hypothetical protein
MLNEKLKKLWTIASRGPDSKSGRKQTSRVDAEVGIRRGRSQSETKVEDIESNRRNERTSSTSHHAKSFGLQVVCKTAWTKEEAQLKRCDVEAVPVHEADGPG